jgi:hypothetical protein
MLHLRCRYLLLVVLATSGCEPEAPALREPQPEPPPTHVAIEPVVALLPGRETQLAVDPAGTIYWLQREDRQPDVLFMRGQDGVPRSTGLSSTAVLQALGVTQAAEGSIHSFTAIDQGQVWFYFQGGTRRQILAALGRYLVDTSEVEIISDTARIQSLTRMGPSLDIARGTIVRSGPWLWLWVRHSDLGVLARFAPADADRAHLHVEQSFTQLVADDGSLPLARVDYELADGPEESLILLDRRWGSIWRVGLDGQATLVTRLTGISRAVSTPSYDAGAQILLFAVGSEPFQSRPEEPYRRPAVDNYPALIVVSETQIQAFAAEHLRGQAGVAPYRLNLQQLVIEPGGRSWLGFDEASGQIVRLRLQ